MGDTYKLGAFVSGPDLEESKEMLARLKLKMISPGQEILKNLVELSSDVDPKSKSSICYLVKPIKFNVYAFYDDKKKDPQMYSMRIGLPYTVYLVDDTINIPLYYSSSITGEMGNPVDVSNYGAEGGKRISRKRTYRRKTRKVKSRRRA